jgi:DNA-3-methyladenine glycosylase
VLIVAREMVGQILVHDSPEGRISGRIVEAEAYRGPEDRAAHSFGGRRTPRTEAMFGPPGHAYVFFVYGMHWHFNAVVARAGEPHAVLIRAVEPLEGLDLMATRRGISPDRVELTNGPGKLCEAFGIDRAHYAADLCKGSLFIARGVKARVARTTRVGIDYAGAWAKRTWRFYEPGNRYVSKPPRANLRPK